MDVKLQVGCEVRTNYGTGPYIVEKITGPCNCPKTFRVESEEPSEDHYHLFCSGRDGGGRKGKFYLNGYTLEGKSVWNNDELSIRLPEGVQIQLILF